VGAIIPRKEHQPEVGAFVIALEVSVLHQQVRLNFVGQLLSASQAKQIVLLVQRLLLSPKGPANQKSNLLQRGLWGADKKLAVALVKVKAISGYD